MDTDKPHEDQGLANKAGRDAESRPVPQTAPAVSENPGESVFIRGSTSAGSATAGLEDASTGLPGLRSWRSVYWVVFGCFLLWMLLLALLARAFA